MIRAAVDAAQTCPRAPKIIAVTMLTSLDKNDLSDIGVLRSAQEQVAATADLALTADAHGVVCSPQEVGALRKRAGASPILITPGIRLPTDQAGDQKRISTPAGAVRDGSSFLVVGRPIVESPAPADAALKILDDMAKGE